MFVNESLQMKYRLLIRRVTINKLTVYKKNRDIRCKLLKYENRLFEKIYII